MTHKPTIDKGYLFNVFFNIYIETLLIIGYNIYIYKHKKTRKFLKKGVQKLVNQPKKKTSSAEDTTMESFSIRIDLADKKLLKDHFSERGLKLTTGIRMIIKEYINKNLK